MGIDGAAISGRHVWLLTSSLGAKMKLLATKGLLVPSQSFFQGIQQDFVNFLTRTLPEYVVMHLDMNELAEDIWTQADSFAQSKCLIISTAQEIAVAKHGMTLEINRLYAPDGSFLGHGARPGHPNLLDQFAAIDRRRGNAPVILVEDGTFSGSTLQLVVDELGKHHIPLEGIVLGFAFPKAYVKLESRLPGKIHIIHEVGDPIDWMPDHDFFPGVPNCGRVIGHSIYGQNHAFMPWGDLSYSIPYIKPWGDPTSWASIPEDRVNLVSEYCLHLAIEMYREIEKLNGNRQLRIVDLQGIRPAICFPVGLGQQSLPPHDLSVTTILHEAIELFS